jgi:hypothetical protein
MGFLTLTNATLTDPADKTEVEDNFTDVQTILNGGIDNDNIAASAGIDITKLAAYNYEFLVAMHVWSASVLRPAVSATIPICTVALPGTTSDGVAYTILSGAWYISDDGDAAAQTIFDVRVGHAEAGAVWTTITTPVAAKTITGVGNTQQSGALTIAVPAITLDAAIQYHFGLFLTTLDATPLTAEFSHLDVTLKLRRTDGLR